MRQEISDATRLLLIQEAIVYCRKVRDMGMPSSCYSKALREPIFFLWEKKMGAKFDAAKYISEKAITLSFGQREVVYDHMIPFNYLQNELLDMQEPSLDQIKAVLESYPAAIITREEDKRLTQLGLRSKMPDDWDGHNIFARYNHAGITVVKK